MEFAKKRKLDTADDAVYEAPPPPLDNAVLTEEDARNLLRPLTPEQLIGILQSAVVCHPDVLESVRLLTDKDPALRKLFVRGLAGETTSDSLRRLFSAFGDLDEAIVIHDKATGKSKGFGFVMFKHADSAVLALREPSKKLDGRVTVAQFAAVRSSAPFNTAADVSARKIYVGGVPFEISSERLLSVFSAYGEIEEGPLGFDKTTGKPKGFAFFVYKTEDGARAALIEPLKNIDGHQVACKFAVDNKKAKPGGPQPTPAYNSGPNPYMYAPPVPNGLATRYNPNFGGPNYAPPPSRFPPPPPSSIGVGYSDGPNYGLGGVSMGLPSSQHHQQPPPLGPRGPGGPISPPGGMYQGMPPYY